MTLHYNPYQSSHHAQLIVDLERKELTLSIWEKLHNTSPVHSLFDGTVIDIDTARAINVWAHTPYNQEKIALISFHTATIPAQNALLKIVEEPPLGVRFIFITSNKELLLPTLLSRLEVYSSQEREKETIASAELFIATKNENRMTLPLVIDLLNTTDEENRKDREAVRSFLLDIIVVLRGKKGDPYILEELFELIAHVSAPSSSTKAIIEYLSLRLPYIP